MTHESFARTRYVILIVPENLTVSLKQRFQHQAAGVKDRLVQASTLELELLAKK